VGAAFLIVLFWEHHTGSSVPSNINTNPMAAAQLRTVA
jgi:hypothetical protein